MWEIKMGEGQSRDLAGLLVVSLEQAVAAPYAASRLADAGARVIKVERPEGDFARGYDADARGYSSYFVWLNRGKESIALDLKNPDDMKILKQMLATADVFIQNLMPGALERLGVSMANLRKENPAIITCDISGYGATGPFAQMKAYDFLVQAEVGLAQITGAPEEPGRVGVSICDIAAGMTAHAAILQALVAKGRTGQGRSIEVSLFHALADWMNVPYLQHHYGGRKIKRPGLHHPTIAPYGAYLCGDDRMILISIQNEREWTRFCAELLDAPSMPNNPDFNSNVSNVKEKRTREVLDLLNESLGELIFESDKNGKINRKCKLCDTGELSLKNSFRGGAFIGCSNYPECKFTRPLSKSKAAAQSQLAEPKFLGKHENGNDIFLKNGRFGPYLQYEKVLEENIEEEKPKKRNKTKKKKPEINELLKNVSIPKGIELKSIDIDKAKFLCSLPKSLGVNPENQKEITLNTGRFGPYLKCENKSARLENVEEIFSIGLNRAITLIAEAKPGRMSSSIIKDLGEHPEDKKPVRIMKGQYGPYIKYKSLNATIPEEKDPVELTMEEALILIEKRREYDKNKKSKKKKK